MGTDIKIWNSSIDPVDDQNGFRSGRSGRDHQFTLSSILRPVHGPVPVHVLCNSSIMLLLHHARD